MGRNKEKACEYSVAWKQSSRQRRMRLSASGEGYHNVRNEQLLCLSPSVKENYSLTHMHTNKRVLYRMPTSLYRANVHSRDNQLKHCYIDGIRHYKGSYSLCGEHTRSFKYFFFMLNKANESLW